MWHGPDGFHHQVVFNPAARDRRPARWRLASEFWSFLSMQPARPDPAAVPDGRGHSVLVVPGYLTDDGFTRTLRDYLSACGFRPFGWELGVNWGPTPRLHAGLRGRLADLAAREGGPVSVVGHSLGGVLARDLAYDRPEQVRCVVTLASPFSLPTASTLEPLLRLCARFYDDAADPRRLARPLPVPSLAIYTRGDGLVAWQSCHRPGEDSLEVEGGHTTICRNGEALRAVAAALARAAPPGTPGPGTGLASAGS